MLRDGLARSVGETTNLPVPGCGHPMFASQAGRPEHRQVKPPASQTTGTSNLGDRSRRWRNLGMLTAGVNSRGGMNTPLRDPVHRETVRIQALQFTQKNDRFDASMVDSFPIGRRNDNSEDQRENSVEQRNFPLFFRGRCDFGPRISAAKGPSMAVIFMEKQRKQRHRSSRVHAFASRRLLE